MKKENKEITVANNSNEIVPVAKQKLEGLLAIMHPNKPGMDEVEATWLPPIIRIHQNNSRNPPAHSTPGCLYTDTGEVLEKPWKFYPLYVHQTNTNLEEDAEGNFIVCRSEDGIISTRGIKCAECPKAPYKNKEVIQCRKTIEYFVIDEELTKIYKIIFSKTSYRVGTKLLRQISSTQFPWQRKYALGVEQNTRNMHKYYVFTASPTTEVPPPEYLPLLARLCEEITKQRKRYLENIQNQVAAVEEALHSVEEEIKDI